MGANGPGAEATCRSMIPGMNPAEAFTLACAPSRVGVALLASDWPATPAHAEAFNAWRNAVLAALLEASGPELALPALFGVYVGDVLLFANLLARELPVGTAVAGLRGEIEAARGRLAVLVGTPQATPVVRRIGGEILALLPALRDATDAAAARGHAESIETWRLAIEAALAMAHSAGGEGHS